MRGTQVRCTNQQRHVYEYVASSLLPCLLNHTFTLLLFFKITAGFNAWFASAVCGHSGNDFGCLVTSLLLDDRAPLETGRGISQNFLHGTIFPLRSTEGSQYNYNRYYRRGLIGNEMDVYATWTNMFMLSIFLLWGVGLPGLGVVGRRSGNRTRPSHRGHDHGVLRNNPPYHLTNSRPNSKAANKQYDPLPQYSRRVQSFPLPAGCTHP